MRVAMNSVCLFLFIFFARGFCFPQNTNTLIAKAAVALEPKLIEIHRDFHRYTELANKEIQTSRIVAERLKALRLDVRSGYRVVGIMKK